MRLKSKIDCCSKVVHNFLSEIRGVLPKYFCFPIFKCTCKLIDIFKQLLWFSTEQSLQTVLWGIFIVCLQCQLSKTKICVVNFGANMFFHKSRVHYIQVHFYCLPLNPQKLDAGQGRVNTILDYFFPSSVTWWQRKKNIEMPIN